MVIPFGFIMMRVPAGEVQNQLFDLHRSIGFLILCLSVIRVFVRVVKGAPPPASLPRWQVRLSSGVHHLLYVLIVVMPLLGWATSSAFGASVRVFGLFTLPDLVAKNEPLSDLLGEMHRHQSEEFVIRGRVLPAHEVIASATTVAARLLRMEGQIGTVAAGA
ncbi:MAG: hypothetical protein B7X76_08250, partial [Azorhizobium sp. 39-67-5]